MKIVAICQAPDGRKVQVVLESSGWCRIHVDGAPCAAHYASAEHAVTDFLRYNSRCAFRYTA